MRVDFNVPMKDGVVQDLTDGTGNAIATSVFVSGNDVYVAGYEWSVSQNRFFDRLWKNGVVQNLEVATGYSMAHSVFVSGSDVYMVGSQTWKNGNMLYTNAGNSIFVSGSDVYVAGRDVSGYSNVSRLWINGVAQTGYGGGTNASSVFVSGSDVYVVGDMNYNTMNANSARLWINGVQQHRPLLVVYFENENYFAAAHSVYVSGSNILCSRKI